MDRFLRNPTEEWLPTDHSTHRQRGKIEGSVRDYRSTDLDKAGGESETRNEGKTMSAALVLEGITKVFGAGSTAFTVLHETSMRVQAGELVAVMGPSGSGKSTLLSIAGGLESPSAGRVFVNDNDVSAMHSDKRADFRIRNIGYVFQELNLISALTARENVALPLELDGMSAGKAAVLAGGQLEQVGLGSRGNMFPDDLSGGERQRVAIARALVPNPRGTAGRLVLADEPTGSLDSVNGEGIMRLLVGACQQGATVVFVTHDAQLAAWADRIVFLRDGLLVDSTAENTDPGPDEVFAPPVAS